MRTGQALLALTLGLSTLTVTGAAGAALVTESEATGEAVNNSTGTAMALPGSAFMAPAPDTTFGNFPTVTINGSGGGDDVDFYSFFTGGGDAFFDIDNDPFTFDTILSLFDDNGTLIAEDDDSYPVDPGGDESAFDGDYDAFLGSIQLAPGRYFLAVTEYSNFAVADCASSQDLERPDSSASDTITGGESLGGCAFGNSAFEQNGSDEGEAYTLHISLANTVAPVPEPGLLGLFASGLIGLGFAARRRKA